MDSTYLTALRTGLAGALATHVLARPEATRSRSSALASRAPISCARLATLRSVRCVQVYDVDAARGAELGVPVVAAPSVAHAVHHAGIVLAATWARSPFILPGMLSPGTHVTTLGPDEPGKAEVSAKVIRDALFVCDDRALAVEMGALGGVGLGDDAVGAELGEVLGGTHPGRTTPEQVTVYGGVGSPSRMRWSRGRRIRRPARASSGGKSTFSAESRPVLGHGGASLVAARERVGATRQVATLEPGVDHRGP